jgi:DNA-binding beta-propeller fold protein YncE
MKQKLILVASVLSLTFGFAVQGESQWAFDTAIGIGPTSFGASGIAITSDGRKLVVANDAKPGKVKIISTSNYAVSSIDISSIGDYPTGVAIAPDNATAYVTTTHKVVMIDINHNSIKGSFAAPCIATTLYGIAVTPDGGTVVFPDLSSGCTQGGLRVMDAAGSSSSFIKVSTHGVSTGVVIDPKDNSAIVTDINDGPKKVTVSPPAVLDITGMTSSFGIAMLHHSDEALIGTGDSIDRVSLVTNSVTKRIVANNNSGVQTIAITADDKYAFVVGPLDKSIISLADNTVIQSFSAGGNSVACATDGSRFYVTIDTTVRVYTRAISGVTDRTGTSTLRARSYPNPFLNSTSISFTTPERGPVQVTIVNLLGTEVARVFSGELEAGKRTFTWDARGMPPGIYWCEVRMNGNVERAAVLKSR